MRLSKRLRVVADMVKPGNAVADIGCDHGYLSVWLVREHIAAHAIAMDLREGPLSSAKENIRFFHQEQKIETRLSDGMDELKPGEADRIVIAGMGGILMRDILERGRECVLHCGQMVLQPQSDPDLVRKKVHELGFRITDERSCFEDGKYYVAFSCEPGIEEHPYNEAEYLYGRILPAKKDPVYRKFLKTEEQKRAKLIETLTKSDKPSAKERLEGAEEERNRILFCLGKYKEEE